MNTETNEFVYSKDLPMVQLIKRLLSFYGISEEYSNVISKDASLFLNDEGYTQGTGSEKVITEKGLKAGITYVQRKDNKTHEKFTSLYFGEPIQKILYAKIPEFKKAVDAKYGGEYHPTSHPKPKDVSHGIFYGEEISFNRTFADHLFTDDEVERLLKGEMVEFVSPINGRIINGHLQQRIGKSGRSYFGFTPEWDENFKKDNQPEYNKYDAEYHPGSEDRAQGIFYGLEISFNRTFDGHLFTDDEVERLLKGEMVEFFSPKSGMTMKGHLQHRIAKN